MGPVFCAWCASSARRSAVPSERGASNPCSRAQRTRREFHPVRQGQLSAQVISLGAGGAVSDGSKPHQAKNLRRALCVDIPAGILSAWRMAFAVER